MRNSTLVAVLVAAIVILAGMEIYSVFSSENLDLAANDLSTAPLMHVN